MNIFVVDDNPTNAGKMLCDKHVVKMILESAQLLSTAHRVLDDEVPDIFYKKTHVNHPCAIWTRETSGNYYWLYFHFMSLCDEYTYRYRKKHLTDTKLSYPLMSAPKNIKRDNVTDFSLCMPDEYKSDDPVKSYRNYYIGEKSDIAKWNSGREAPEWYKYGIANKEENHDI